MVFLRRDRSTAPRFTGLRVGLLFLAMGVWLAGIQLQSGIVTGVAIGIAAFALLVGLFGRRRSPDHAAAEEESDEVAPPPDWGEESER